MGANKLILGTVQMGLAYGVNNSGGQITPAGASIILEHAFSKGIFVLDTAAAYGTAHQVIGDYHRNHTNRFEVITKIPGSIGHFEPEQLIEKYIHELHVDNLHCLMFHSFSGYVQMEKGVLNGLQAYKEQGIIRKLGVSVYTNEEMMAVAEDERIDVIQLPFNMLDNLSMRGECLQKASEKGRTIHTRSAFLQGLFFKPVGDHNRIVKTFKPQLTELHRLAEQQETSMGAMALNYCLMQDTIDKVIIGIDSLDQLHANLEWSKQSLPENILRQIDNIIVSDKKLLNPALWD